MKRKITLICISVMLILSASAQDGTLDGSFNASAFFVGTGHVYDFKIQPDGKYVLGGGFVVIDGMNFTTGIARLESDGSKDPSFNLVSVGTIRSVDLQSDGKILLGGISGPMLYRLNSDGTVDNTFDPGTGANGFVWKVLSLPDGKILTGGAFTEINGTPVTRIARLNADGSVDNTFNTGGAGFTGGRVVDMALQPDGKILVTGDFNMYNGVARKGVARLHADGTLDNTFDPGMGTLPGGVEAIVLQPDGKMIIVGEFTSYDGTTANRIARLNIDGTLDATFTAGFSNHVQYALALQPDGKVLVGGASTLMGTTQTVARLVRLLPSGALDTLFNPGGNGPDARVWAVQVQPDGKIMMAGEFSNYNGVAAPRFIRLNGTGDPNIGTETLNALHTSMYPNPANQQISLNNVPINADVAIHDLSGRLLFTTQTNATSHTVDVSSLPNGAYLLRIRHQNSVSAKKFVVSR